MQEYKYTYQDWLEGKIVIPTGKFNVPYLPSVWPQLNLLSREECNRVIKLQDEAYKYLVEKETQHFIYLFLDGYNTSCMQQYDITRTIERIEKDIAEFKVKYRPKWNMAMAGADGRESFTYDDIQLIYSENFGESVLWESFAADDHPFTLIYHLNCLQWMKWFKEHEHERFASIQKQHYQIAVSAESKEDLEEKKVTQHYTWPNLFLDSRQAEKILSLLSEYLSDTGQWLENGRTLVALYAELKQKGYLKQNLSGEKVANALNRQFGTNFDKRNFQPADLLKAESYRDRFTYIPPYAPNGAIA